MHKKHPQSRHPFRSFGFSLIVLLILAACGQAATPPTQVNPTTLPTDTPPTAVPALANSADKALVIWSTGSDVEALSIQAAADVFVQKNPGVLIKVQALPWSDAHTQILEAIAADRGPDLMAGGMSWGIEFGKLGGMIDLQKQYPAVVTEVKQKMLPQLQDSLFLDTGEVYALQLDVALMGMFYRTDLLRDLVGMQQAPQNWTELTKVLEKSKTINKKGFAIGWDNAGWISYFTFLYSAGGSLYSDDCSKATINSAAGLQALTYFRDLYTKYQIPTDTSLDIEGGLESGDYLVSYAGTWTVAALEFNRPALAGKWAVAPLPKSPKGQSVSFLGGRVIGVMEASQNKDLAAEFIRFLYTDEAVAAQSTYAQSANNYYVPPSLPLLSAAKLPTNIEAGFRGLLEQSAGPPKCVGWEESTSDVQKLLQEVVYNNADPQDALDQAAEIMNRNLQP
ncbi:sugar ABC transporter substrate-binding protein [Herpetosiphon giganteus]|uniref:sugar ABC transporter substrate-binding protein n=1 Tax=Herpetosiphon giganteus TaxID=2029754 RepID=UPI00195A9DED|nr:sugar ABC transporter substrate-binding protein [Herpetosiphon giganteus]MBM7842474.1 ABC-type glycerol-3-phosphate transport system substrate-binding protein [Herpetosiphon giganteus]